MSEKKVNPIDKHVGIRMRLRRHMLKLSQERLGELIGVTFQQIQKYEKGLNRVGASRLKSIADALKIDVSYFFAEEKIGINQIAEPAPDVDFIDFCSTSEIGKLMQSFQKIENSSIRKTVLKLVDHLAEISMEAEAANEKQPKTAELTTADIFDRIDQL